MVTTDAIKTPTSSQPRLEVLITLVSTTLIGAIAGIIVGQASDQAFEGLLLGTFLGVIVGVTFSLLTNWFKPSSSQDPPPNVMTAKSPQPPDNPQPTPMLRNLVLTFSDVQTSDPVPMRIEVLLTYTGLGSGALPDEFVTRDEKDKGTAVPHMDGFELRPVGNDDVVASVVEAIIRRLAKARDLEQFGQLAGTDELSQIILDAANHHIERWGMKINAVIVKHIQLPAALINAELADYLSVKKEELDEGLAAARMADLGKLISVAMSISEDAEETGLGKGKTCRNVLAGLLSEMRTMAEESWPAELDEFCTSVVNNGKH